MATPEGKCKKKFLEWLDSAGFKYIVNQASATTRRGVPDVIVIFGKFWAYLEFKRSETAPKRPGQQENVDYANEVGWYGAFVYPANVMNVKNDLLKFASKQIGSCK